MTEPTNPTPPPPPSGMPTGVVPPPPSGPQVRIGEWFNEAWKIIQPVWLEFVLAVLVYELVLGIAYFLCLVPAIILVGPLTGGLFVYCAKRLLKMPVEVGDIFKGFRRFGDTLVLSLVLFLIPIIFAAILILPGMVTSLGIGADSRAVQETAAALTSIASCLGCVGIPLFLIVYPILVGTFFIFAFPLVMFEGRKATEALRESFALVKPKFGNFLALLLANWVIMLLASSVGSLLLCIGSLVLTPLAISVIVLMQLLAYRDFKGLKESDVAPFA